MIRYFLSLLICISVTFGAFSQKNPLRIEITADIDNDAFHVVPCKDYGFLIFYETIKQIETKEKIWSFNFYNEEFKAEKNYEIPVLKDAFFFDDFTDNKFAYMVFYHNGKTKDNSHNLIILRFDPVNEAFDAFKAHIEDKSKILDAKSADEKVFLAFETKRYELGLFVADFRQQELKKLNFTNSGRNLLENIYIDTINRNVKFLINNFISRKENQLKINTYTYSGEKTASYNLKPDKQDIELNSAEMSTLGKNQFLIIGTYNNSAARSSELKNEDEVISAGVYISKIENETAQYLNTYNFLDFENFYTYVNPSEVFKLRKKAGKNNESRDYSLNYRLLLHNIIRNKDQYILLAEAYYPDYKTMSYISYDYYGRPFPQTYTVFEGYEYFSGIITAFSKEGNLLYDNGIKIRNITTFNLKNKLVPFFDQSDLILAYTSEGKIASEIYNPEGETIGQFGYSDIAMKYPKDKLMNTKNNQMTAWYGNYFLCYGYQEIRNNSISGNNKRSVFYVTKVIFE